VLVAARRDRFARSVSIAAVIEETARRRVARVVTPDAPDADDPFAGAMRGMMDVFAQLERALIASRTRGALAAKRARGEKTGGSLPVGFALADDGKRLVADADEAGAVATIRGQHAERLSIRAIAERMNVEGAPARGGRWHPTTIARILKRAS
jgi:DNA invertase Pin-like site-specific DNA recombinase